MKQIFLFIVILVLPLALTTDARGAFDVHHVFQSSPIKTFKDKNGQTLTLERAEAGEERISGVEVSRRLQVRHEYGNIVAYTPTRLTAIPFCFGRNTCWAFLWKTVYPLPAIYKFDPDSSRWSAEGNPPMQYSRRHVPVAGFDLVFNPFLAFFSLLLLFKEKAAFFVCAILFTIILTLQITKYRDLPEFQQEWIRRVFLILFGLSPLPFQVEPYTITAFLIFMLAGIGILYEGIPLVVSVFIIIATFYLCAMRLARLKTAAMGKSDKNFQPEANDDNTSSEKEEKMEDEDIVLLQTENGLATVTLNRPEVHNAFNADVIASLAEIWDELGRRDDVIAVVLKGNGKSFSAGADLNWMKEAADYSEEQNYEDALKLATMLHKLYTLPKLTIACVFGAAMGGGMGLVSCCDVVIADAEAKFALSEVRLGLIPATIAPYVIRAMGERQARRFFQTGERFDGKTAYKINFVHELAERPEDVEYLLHSVLQDVEKNGPQAMMAAKKLCLDFAGQEITGDTLKDTAKRIAETRAGSEAREGVAAFFEKRKAKWVKD